MWSISRHITPIVISISNLLSWYTDTQKDTHTHTHTNTHTHTHTYTHIHTHFAYRSNFWRPGTRRLQQACAWFTYSNLTLYRIMQIVRSGKLSWFLWISLQSWKFSSKLSLAYYKVFWIAIQSQNFPTNNKIMQPQNFSTTNDLHYTV